MTGHDDFGCHSYGRRKVMPLNDIPEFFHPEIRQLIDFALEDAWQEVRNERLADTALVRGRLATTIVALAAIGETNPIKLKNFALHATRAAFRPRRRPPLTRQSAPCTAAA
jgi:hypothetical protein